jgi:hypothetical protein
MTRALEFWLGGVVLLAIIAAAFWLPAIIVALEGK